MFKLFTNILVILSVCMFSGLKANAEYWQPVNNKIGNIIYVDTDSIRMKDNKVFYNVKYHEEKLDGDSKLLIMSEKNIPFVVGDPIAFKNTYFMINLNFVNEKVMSYVEKNYIPEVEEGSDFDNIDINLEPYAQSVTKKIKGNLKYKFAYRNSSARAMIKINKQGELKKVYIYESSGNQKLNIALTKAIEASEPFDSLPEKYNKTFAILWIDVKYGKDKSVILVNSVVSLGKMILK